MQENMTNCLVKLDILTLGRDYCLILIKKDVAIYSVLVFLILFASFRFLPRTHIIGLNKWELPLAFLFKSVVGVTFLFIYTEFYGTGSLTADAGAFMSESYTLNQVFYESPIDYIKFLTGIGDTSELRQQYLSQTFHWDVGGQSLLNDNKNILRIHSLIHFFSLNYETVHVFIMCTLSLVGTYQLVIGLRDLIKLKNSIIFWIIILIPSVIFWTSGMLKEPILFLGFSILFRGILDNISRGKRFLLLVLGIIILLGFKPYVLLCLIPSLFFLIFFKIFPKFKLVSSISALILAFSICLIAFPNISTKALHLLTRKQEDFKNVGKGGIYAIRNDKFIYFEPAQFKYLKIVKNKVSVRKPIKAEIVDVGGMESPVSILLKDTNVSWHIYFMREQSNGYIELTPINYSFSRLFFNLPEAIRNSLFRPFWNDPGSCLKHLATIEIYITFFILFWAITKRRQLETRASSIVFSLIIFVLLLSIIIGLTTPVLGAIVRYRFPAILGIIIISMIVIEPSNKFRKK